LSFEILAFAGSLRRGSYNRGLLRAAQELAPGSVAIEIFELHDMPLYNYDLEVEGDPPRVRDFKQRIRDSDALLIATPEHSNSIPGVLKNALDWAARPSGAAPLERKPIAIMGATPGRFGTANAQQALRAVFVFSESYVMLRPQVRVSDAGERFDEDGNLRDEETRRRVLGLVESLVRWTRRFQLELD
jgi:chromate reductase